MRILFLPNFKVHSLSQDDQSILSPNKYVANEPYWFFKYFPNSQVDIIDNSNPFPFSIISKYAKIEIFQALKALYVSKNYDLIISHSYNSGFIFSLLRSIFGISKPPHIIIDIGCLNGGKKKFIQIIILKLALTSVKGLIYHSKINEDFYRMYFPNMSRSFVPFGTDPYFFKPINRPPRRNFALSIGYDKRDYDTLINAWSRIDFPLLIIGKIDVDTKNLKNVKLQPMVTIHELKEYIHDSKIIILPIENERYSVGQMTFTQSMSMSKAVLIYDVPGVRDYFIDNCIALNYKDEFDIETKVKLLLSNKGLIEKLSLNARNSVLDNFNEEQMAKKIYKFISDLSL